MTSPDHDSVKAGVTAALAIIEGFTAVGDEDWELSGILMAVSDRTRAEVQRVLTSEQRENNKRQAEAEATRTIVVQERVNEAAVRRVSGSIKRLLSKVGSEGATGSKVRGCVHGPDKQYVTAALTSLTLAGDVSEQKIEYHGQMGVRYWLTNLGPDHG